MNTLHAAVLATEADQLLPAAGWVVLALGLLVTIAWVAYLYR
ncbi:hypothetical protein [Natrinema sp. 74]